MKKLLLIVLGMLITLPALARDFEYTHDGQTLTYTVLSEEEKTVGTKQGSWRAPGNNVSGELRIPSTVKDSAGVEFTVTEIGERSFYECSGLTSVSIPVSVTEIGDQAFEYCFALTKAEFGSVESMCNIKYGYDYSNPLYVAHNLWIDGKEVKDLVIPTTVTAIGDSAFAGGSGLTSVAIPTSVTKIGDWAFEDCTGLTSVTIPYSVTELSYIAFSGCDGLIKSAYPSTLIDPFGAQGLVVAYSPEGAIIEDGFIYSAGKKSLFFAPLSYQGEYTIPDSVEEIGKYAFAECTGLTSVNIPSSVTSIGYWAFYRCRGLSSIYIPNSVTYISDGAFINCSGLTSVVIPNSVTEIGFRVFYFCRGLTSVTIPDSVTEIGEWAFSDCSALTTVTIPESVTKIGRSAFEHCRSLTSVTIPESVTEIGDSAFLGCHGLTSVTIPNSINKIDVMTFYGCNGLTSVTIPNSVTEIGYEAFAYCRGLTSVSLGSGVQSIGRSAFANTAITAITLPAEVTSIGREAFRNTSLNWIESLNPVPPTLAEDFNSQMNYQNCTLIIPTDSYLDYIQAPVWNRFAVHEGRLDFEAGEGLNAECEIVSDEAPASAPKRTTSTDPVSDAMPVANGQTLVLEKGSVLRFRLTTEIDTDITKIFFNGEDVTDDIVNGVFTTPVIDGPVSMTVETMGKVKTEIELSQSEVTLQTGDTFQLEAIVTPASEDPVVWTSSDESVATVSEMGLLTAVSEGTAVITVTCGEATATCKVTVNLLSGVEEIIGDAAVANIYTLSGTVVLRNATMAEIRSLEPGLYFVRQGEAFRKIAIH